MRMLISLADALEYERNASWWARFVPRSWFEGYVRKRWSRYFVAASKRERLKQRSAGEL